VKERNGGGISLIFTVSSDREAALIVKRRKALKGAGFCLYDQLSHEELQRKKKLFPHFDTEKAKKISDGSGVSRNQQVWFIRDRMFVEKKEFLLPTNTQQK
jgi:hypothetical protein